MGTYVQWRYSVMHSAYSDHKDFLIERQGSVVGAPGHVTIYPLLVLPVFWGSTRICPRILHSGSCDQKHFCCQNVNLMVRWPLCLNGIIKFVNIWHQHEFGAFLWLICRNAKSGTFAAIFVCSDPRILCLIRKAFPIKLRRRHNSVRGTRIS